MTYRFYLTDKTMPLRLEYEIHVGSLLVERPSPDAASNSPLGFQELYPANVHTPFCQLDSLKTSHAACVPVRTEQCNTVKTFQTDAPFNRWFSWQRASNRSCTPMLALRIRPGHTFTLIKKCLRQGWLGCKTSERGNSCLCL